MVDVTETLDCMGDVCPYPDVKSKRKVKKMKSGEVLKVLVDYPLSADDPGLGGHLLRADHHRLLLHPGRRENHSGD